MTASAISNAILTLRAMWVETGRVASVEAINHGPCATFARDVCSIIHGARYIWDGEIDTEQDVWVYCHCFVVYRGRFYDALCPDGVDRWWELPYFSDTSHYFEVA